MSTSPKRLALIPLMLAVTLPATAGDDDRTVVIGTETIEIPVGSQRQDLADFPRPTRGMSENAVLEGWGVPEERTSAVGVPPISQWHYPDFSVYFESGVVIHSVLRQRRGAAETPQR